MQHYFFLKWGFFGTLATDGATHLWLGCDKRWNCAVLAMAMARSTYHIVLVPKYRYQVFYNKQLKKDCESIFNNICMEQGYKIHAMEIVEDHVHLFLEFHPSTSLSKVVQYLKGGSSYRLFRLHPELKKRYCGGSLWSSGKFFRSVGNVTVDTVKHYIKESQGKPKAEFQSCKSGESGQRRLEDF